jgi:hypothetical protein
LTTIETLISSMKTNVPIPERFFRDDLSFNISSSQPYLQKNPGIRSKPCFIHPPMSPKSLRPIRHRSGFNQTTSRQAGQVARKIAVDVASVQLRTIRITGISSPGACGQDRESKHRVQRGEDDCQGGSADQDQPATQPIETGFDSFCARILKRS